MKGILNILLSAAALALTAVLLVGLGRQQGTAARPAAARDLTQARQTLQVRLTKLESGLPEPEPCYRIEDPNAAAPMPDQSRYGQADSPAQMEAVLEQARDLLEGQELYFSTETELFPGSVIGYYLDETILAIAWKQRVDNTAFTFVEVKLRDPSQFRRYMSGGSFGSGQLSLTSEMARDVQAVVACSGDYYSYRRRGLIIVNGTVEKFVPGLDDTCYINGQGDLILERGQDFPDKEAVQAYADANDIRFSLSFGPILVKDGENVCPRAYPLGEVTQRYSRAALCQMGTLHYLYIAAGTEGSAYALMSMRTFSKHVAQTGCAQAYALDGGQTTTVVLNNEVFNHVNYGSERRISDIIYFATAVPEGA